MFNIIGNILRWSVPVSGYPACVYPGGVCGLGVRAGLDGYLTELATMIQTIMAGVGVLGLLVLMTFITAGWIWGVCYWVDHHDR